MQNVREMNEQYIGPRHCDCHLYGNFNLQFIAVVTFSDIPVLSLCWCRYWNCITVSIMSVQV